MPDAGASRKRQIQVTPGPFSDATAGGARSRADGAGLGGFLEDFAISNTVEWVGRVERYSIKPCSGDLRRRLRFAALDLQPWT